MQSPGENLQKSWPVDVDASESRVNVIVGVRYFVPEAARSI
jgi:hypothetical protein